MLNGFPGSVEDKTVAIIHPAWHSCGSHAVFCSQAAAYRAMGARVLSLAVGTTPDQGTRNRGFWAQYYGMTADLAADERYHTGPSRYSLLLDRGRLLRAFELLNCDYAAQMAGLAELSPLPGGIAGCSRIDLVHCNHYFNMPLALRLKERFAAPILLETHDVQSRQYQLRGAKALFSKRQSSLAEMEDSELALVAKADALVHINADEHAYFSQRLPDHKHTLLYPALGAPKALDHEPFFLAVASANYPNYLGIRWLLESVLPVAGPVRLAIVGNVDGEFRERAPALYKRHKRSFRGRVDNLQRYYDTAAAVLLPVVAGHGLAIKTVEALESGVPLIATSLAFRGMAIDPATIENLRLADTPDAFGRHMAEIDTGTGTVAEACRRVTTSSRKVFNELFSFPRYVEKLERLACGLLAGAGAAQRGRGRGEAYQGIGAMEGSFRRAALR